MITRQSVGNLEEPRGRTQLLPQLAGVGIGIASFRRGITFDRLQYRAQGDQKLELPSLAFGGVRQLCHLHQRFLKLRRRWRSRQPDSVDIVVLALLTGARRGELLGMRWDQLDLTTGIWTKPHPTTKQRQVHRTPLSQDAVTVLRRRKNEHADEFVFRDRGAKTHSNRFEDHWREIRAEAGLTDVRFHDLRHSFASHLAGAGLSLPTIGRMLGHSKPQTTQRYAHLADEPLRAAAEIAAGKVGKPG